MLYIPLSLMKIIIFTNNHFLMESCSYVFLLIRWWIFQVSFVDPIEQRQLDGGF
jgi:hypothetical protein